MANNMDKLFLIIRPTGHNPAPNTRWLFKAYLKPLQRYILKKEPEWKIRFLSRLWRRAALPHRFSVKKKKKPRPNPHTHSLFFTQKQ